MCLYMCVMVDQREALAVTTRLTDTVYFGSPYRDYLMIMMTIIVIIMIHIPIQVMKKIYQI
jgi:hypothetical protein